MQTSGWGKRSGEEEGGKNVKRVPASRVEAKDVFVVV